MRKIVWAIMLVGLLAAPAHAAVYWDDEMETFPGGPNQFDTLPGGQQVVASPKFSGAGALQYNYPDLCQAENGCGGWTDRYFPVDAASAETNEHYGRLYIRIGQNFKHGTFNGFSKFWGVRSSTGINKTWFTVRDGLGMVFQAENTPNTGQTTNVGVNFTLPREQWACIEWHFKRNDPIGTPTGILEIWANGTRTVNRTNMQWTGPTGNTSVGWNHIRMYRQAGGPLVTGQGEVAHVWFDRVATGNTRIGCVVSDTTPPSIPGSFTVQ